MHIQNFLCLVLGLYNSSALCCSNPKRVVECVLCGLLGNFRVVFVVWMEGGGRRKRRVDSVLSGGGKEGMEIRNKKKEDLDTGALLQSLCV